MAQLTESELNTKIAAIDVKIDALVANPEVDYKIGSKSVSASQKMKQLVELRKMYVQLRDEMPAEDISDFHHQVNEFGEDKTEYQGDV